MHYHITFPADFKNVPPLRDLAAHMAQLCEFSKEQSEHVRSVVDELCSNAIEYGSQPTSQVDLELFAESHQFRVVCSDQGHGDKMTAEDIRKKIQEPVLISAMRGRGIGMIVQSFVSQLDFRDRPGGGIMATALLRKT